MPKRVRPWPSIPLWVPWGGGSTRVFDCGGPLPSVWTTVDTPSGHMHRPLFPGLPGHDLLGWSNAFRTTPLSLFHPLPLHAGPHSVRSRGSGTCQTSCEPTVGRAAFCPAAQLPVATAGWQPVAMAGGLTAVTAGRLPAVTAELGRAVRVHALVAGLFLVRVAVALRRCRS